MSSGIPQGSALGPILFVIYINTLVAEVKDSKVYLFADGAEFFKGVFNSEGCNKMQIDIDNLMYWTYNSLLNFHPGKCGIMRTRKSNVADRTYTMGSKNTK